MKLGCVFGVAHPSSFLRNGLCFQYLLQRVFAAELTTHLFFKDDIISLNANKPTFLLYLVMQGGDITKTSFQYGISSVIYHSNIVLVLVYCCL